ncbi:MULTISPECIES: SLC13 family permease [Halorussus]|uniref:SLC13 family permease n=1 Tax=Halorussus TaxID=1070314 RepID=UPI00209CDB52|nr:SLC13 family permease [Halorussus vallis]USZ77854.1 SLC13 family permease [Halorussus vallis]
MTASRRRDTAVVVAAVFVTLVIAAVPTPGEPSPDAQRALATAAFAGILWVTGALPLSITALTVPVWLTVLGVYPTLAESLSGFADPVVFLFLAAFVLAAALQKHDLDRRLALQLLGRIGTTPRRIVAGVMVVTAGLSMVVSNTATAALMAPVAVSLVRQVDVATERSVGNFRVAALLGVAYAGSIGGIGTPVGTPPNAIVISRLNQAGFDVGFAEWLAVGLPVVAVTLPLAWYVLVRVYPPEDVDVSVAREHARLTVAADGPPDRTGRRVAVVFAATAALWVFGSLGFLFEDLLSVRWHATVFGGVGPWLFGPGGHQGLLYFALVGLAAIPALYLVGGVEREDLGSIDWNTLVLFGGGLALADALSDTGATDWLATQVLALVGDASIVVVVAAVVALTVLLSEIASNTGTAALLAPVLIEVGRGFPAVGGVEGGVAAALVLPIASAVAASYGFALPVATPPNAIVYGSGGVTRGQMLRAGTTLDLVFVFVTTAVMLALAATVWPVVF